VKAVCGIFLRQPLGRYRNAEQTHVYIQRCEGSQETDGNEIYRRHEQNAIRTGEHCDFDEHRIYAVTALQQSMLKLQSMLEAEHNRLTNDPLSWFVALARDEGYQVEYCDGEDRGISEALKNAGEQIAQADKEAILAAKPVTHEELDAHRANGTLTPEVRVGHKRFEIEDTVGCECTSPVYVFIAIIVALFYPLSHSHLARNEGRIQLGGTMWPIAAWRR